MSESQQIHQNLDPSLVAGDAQEIPELRVRYQTFSEAHTASKNFSDTFIDGAITGSGVIKVGNERKGIKGYLDSVEVTQADNEVISDPEAIAGLYVRTTEMLARNLKVRMHADVNDPAGAAARATEIITARDQFLGNLRSEAGEAAKGIVDWCNGTERKFPVRAVEYKGFSIDGGDPLDAKATHSDDLRPNFKMQRSFAGTFIMAYSDTRVVEKMQKRGPEMTRRIYLNPDVLATPEIFEQILRAANDSGLSIQLKMIQRASELATAHRKRATGTAADSLRGDGIVVYANSSQADDVLAMVLAIAKDRPGDFVGRKTSRVPQVVADGIAVGDEPLQGRDVSLTSHRTMILEEVADYVQRSGKTGAEARELFRSHLVTVAKANGVDPRNIAFNLNRN